jgi:hypothetical protein
VKLLAYRIFDPINAAAKQDAKAGKPIFDPMHDNGSK